jgi:hypothetical protein
VGLCKTRRELYFPNIDGVFLFCETVRFSRRILLREVNRLKCLFIQKKWTVKHLAVNVFTRFDQHENDTKTRNAVDSHSLFSFATHFLATWDNCKADYHNWYLFKMRATRWRLRILSMVLRSSKQGEYLRIMRWLQTGFCWQHLMVDNELEDCLRSTRTLSVHVVQSHELIMHGSRLRHQYVLRMSKVYCSPNIALEIIQKTV